MIIEQQKPATIIQKGLVQDDTIKMSLDLESSSFLMQMLSKNLYSDAIGSIIRETTCNALDSHRKAGIDEPIIVSFGEVEGKYEFSVEDKGIGLNDEDVRNIISQYGKSTKRESNEFIGAMGLGFKSPLAYSSHFFFVCRKDGKERKYMMYEEDDKNSIDLLYTSNTTERNGVKVIVPVDKYDRHDFNQKIQEQLCYFGSVYFNVSGISNDFTITRQEDFQYSGICSNQTMHMTLDDVYYPLDWKALGIDAIRFPVALKFSLTDGLFPLPNRETIRMTKEAVEIIKAKITKVADYFISAFNNSVEDTENPIELYKFIHNSSRMVVVDDVERDVSCFVSHSSIPISTPKIKGIKKLNVKKLLDNYYEYNKLFNEYTINYRIDGYRWKESKRYYDKEIEITRLNNNNRNVLVYSTFIKGAKKEYIKEMYGKYSGSSSCTMIVKKTFSFSLFPKSDSNKDNYYYLLSLKDVPRSEWRELIKEFQYLIELHKKNWIDVESLEPPKEWLERRKAERTKAKVEIVKTGRKIKLEGDVSFKKAVNLERYVSGKNCKWVSEIQKIADIGRKDRLFVYGTAALTEEMDKFFEIKPKNVQFIQVSDRELKTINTLNIHNLISWEKFMEGKNMPFKRMVTAYLIHQLENTYDPAFENIDKLMEVSSVLANNMQLLKEYSHKNYLGCGNDKVWEAVLAIAQEGNLYDENIYNVYIYVKKVLNDMPFINALSKYINRYRSSDNNTTLMQSIKDLCKYHKFKLNYDNYTLPFNEEVVEEKTTDKETILETI